MVPQEPNAQQTKSRLKRADGLNAQATLLLDRLEGLVGGGGTATRRRSYALATERSVARERKAQFVCLQQNRAILKRGFFKLN